MAAGMMQRLQLGDDVRRFVKDTQHRLDVVAGTVRAGSDSGRRGLVVGWLLPAAVVAAVNARPAAAGLAAEMAPAVAV